MNQDKIDELGRSVEAAFNEKIEAAIDIHVKFMENPDFDVRLECETAEDPEYVKMKDFIDEIVLLSEKLLDKERNFRTTLCLAANTIRKEEN